MNKRLGRLLNPNVGAIFVILMAFSALALMYNQLLLAAVEFSITAAVIIVFLLYRVNRRKKLKAFLATTLDQQENVSHPGAPFPMLVFRLADSGIVYVNHPFTKKTGYQEGLSERVVEDVLPGFNTEWLVSGKTEYPYDVTLQDRRYRVYGTVMRSDDPQQTALGILYLTDLTEMYQIRDEYIRSRPVVSIILVDNYEELTKNLSEGAISELNAKINVAITKWTEGYHGLLRRLEKNRFLLVFEKRDLKRAVEDKFSILEDIHEITSPSGLPASISFGLGVDGDTFEESYEFAALSIEMALSRGGDQAVVKDRLNFHFYGGRTKEADHRSKVRSRVTANSLMELIGGSSQVFIMGHRNADLDVIGAALGIRSLCRKKGKEAYIVLDVRNNLEIGRAHV